MDAKIRDGAMRLISLVCRSAVFGREELPRKDGVYGQAEWEGTSDYKIDLLIKPSGSFTEKNNRIREEQHLSQIVRARPTGFLKGLPGKPTSTEAEG